MSLSLIKRLFREKTRPRAGIAARPLDLASHRWTTVFQKESRQWEKARKRARGGKKVLLSSAIGGFDPLAAFETLLGAALTLRGADVHVLRCRGGLPACQMVHRTGTGDWRAPQAYAESGVPPSLCTTCTMSGDEAVALAGFPTLDLLPASPAQSGLGRLPETCGELAAFTFEGVPVGEHAMASCLRYYTRGSLPEDGAAPALLKRFVAGAIEAVTAARALQRRERFEVACDTHGIYVPIGPIGDAFRLEGARSVHWSVAYRSPCFLFSHDRSYHYTFLDEPTRNWETMEWSAAREAQLIAYLDQRWAGGSDWTGLAFTGETGSENADPIAGIGLDPALPTVGLLSNILWDASLFYPSRAFPSMLEWVDATIAHFRNRRDVQLAIRIHPAEVRGTMVSDEQLLPILQARHPDLPPNIAVIPPDAPTNTYHLLNRCDAALIYGTKTGCEVAAKGIPVIVAGDAWIRGKGFTRDVTTPLEYETILRDLPFGRRMDAALTLRAQRYAYHFFFRRMIPVELCEPNRGYPPFHVRVESLDLLREGASRGLDVICRGILEGAPFEFEP
jgi:hypothetical protein